MESTIRDGVPDTLKLIETFGWRPGEGVRYADAHLDRMEASAARLGFPFDREAAQAHFPSSGSKAIRCRLTLDSQGGFDFSQNPFVEDSKHWKVAIHSMKLNSNDPWLQFKSTKRAIYDDARAALPEGINEWLFVNERDEVCEGTITNVFVEIAERRMVTPPLCSGLLPGIFRQKMLESRLAIEQIVTLEDLKGAKSVSVGNSLRGLIPVVVNRACDD